MKERNVSASWGVVGDKLYHTISGTKAETCSHWTPDRLLLDYLYYQSIRSKSLSYSTKYSGGYIGKETFDSTKRQKPLMNDCSHKIIHAVNRPYAMVYQMATQWPRLWYPYYRAAWPNVSIDADFKHLQTEHSGPSRRAWWSMQPRFEGEVSMLNFLFELKDFKDLMKYIVRPKIAYNKISKLLRSPPKGFDPSKPAAGAYLSWQLALKPLLSDLTSIHAQLAQLVRTLQQDFKLAGSEEQSSHYSEILDSVSSLTPGTGNYYNFSMGTYQQTKFTATLHYNYAYKMRGTVDAICKYWGLKPNPEVFWNAIPFSFIMDYFIQIGKSLHAMQIDKNVQLQVNDYAESLVTRLSSGKIISDDDGICSVVLDDKEMSGAQAANKLVSGLEGTIYERRVTRPDYGPALPRIKKPSGKQGLTMAAIVRCLF